MIKEKKRKKINRKSFLDEIECSCGYKGPLKIVKGSPINTHIYWNAYCPECSQHIWHADGVDHSIIKQKMVEILKKQPHYLSKEREKNSKNNLNR